MPDKTILVVGTHDTKDDELAYMAERILEQGGAVVTMDVSVLGDPARPCDITKHDVAEAAGSTIRAAIDGGDENHAMQIMARSASAKLYELFSAGRCDGVVALGGTRWVRTWRWMSVRRCRSACRNMLYRPSLFRP